VEALERSLTEIVRRHEALRTVFANRNGEPVQVITAARPLPLEQLDLSTVAAGEREAKASELAAAEAQAPFALSRGPLVRVKLLKLSAEEQILLLTMHHIISDGWSIGVLIRELTSLYEAYSRGAESPLEELPIQYADYAVWQREWLSGEMLERQLAYWRKQLEGAPAAIELPADYTRPVTQIYRGANEGREVGEAVSARLRQLSRSEGVTLFVTMLAAFKALLWRYGGSGGASDVVVGTPVAGCRLLRCRFTGCLLACLLLARRSSLRLGGVRRRRFPGDRFGPGRLGFLGRCRRQQRERRAQRDHDDDSPGTQAAISQTCLPPREDSRQVGSQRTFCRPSLRSCPLDGTGRWGRRSYSPHHVKRYRITGLELLLDSADILQRVDRLPIDRVDDIAILNADFLGERVGLHQRHHDAAPGINAITFLFGERTRPETKLHVRRGLHLAGGRFPGLAAAHDVWPVFV